MPGVSVKRNGHPHHRNQKNPVKNGKRENLPCRLPDLPAVAFFRCCLLHSFHGRLRHARYPPFAAPAFPEFLPGIFAGNAAAFQRNVHGAAHFPAGYSLHLRSGSPPPAILAQACSSPGGQLRHGRASKCLGYVPQPGSGCPGIADRRSCGRSGRRHCRHHSIRLPEGKARRLSGLPVHAFLPLPL